MPRKHGKDLNLTKKTNETQYAYAVSAVRVRQIKALETSDIDRMIAAPTDTAVLSILESKGWHSTGRISDVNDMLEKELSETWRYLSEVAPDPALFIPFILKNDFHNLKAGIKSVLSDYEADEYFVLPCTIPSDTMKKAVEENRFDDLPAPFDQLGEEMYDILVRTGDGQWSDVIADRAALDETLRCAEKTGDELIFRISELFVAAANIKIAFRSARFGKKEEFLERAVGSCTSLDRDRMIKAATEGVSALLEYLSTTEYADGTALLKTSPSDFERWCDDRAMGMLENVRYIALGTAPLVAYYLGKEAEIRNVRIILAAKQSGLPAPAIRSRIRRLYV